MEEIKIFQDERCVRFFTDDPDRTIRSICDMFDLIYLEAAGGRVINEKGEMLVIFRYGKWDLPKGKIKKNEPPADAAVREVMEETGLENVIAGRELPSTYHIFKGDGRRMLKRTFWFAMTASSLQALVPQTEEDISIVKWAGAKELVSISQTTYASLRGIFDL